MVLVADISSNGRLKRLAGAARKADELVLQVEGLTTGVNGMMVEVSDMLGKANPSLDRIDPALAGVDEMLAHVNGELEQIAAMRGDVDVMLTRVNSLLELVEWIAAPAIAARSCVQRSIQMIREIRTSLTIRIRWESDRHKSEVVQPVDLHLLAS